MKKLLFVFAAMLTVVLVGCKKGAQDAEPEEIKLSVDPSSIISPSVGADYTLTLTAPEAWTASCADSWVKVNPTSGNAGSIEISVKISADKTSTEASSKIVFKSGDQTVEVPVKRLAKDPARLMVVSETEIQTPKDGGVYSVKVESNIKWQISSNASWAKI
ncbi:MAG: BACON domain-containing protein, partial [Paludibacteraceae bacterium]|nr:BACON domain-containing protein [Paludibacteraceae bacterium]